MRVVMKQHDEGGASQTLHEACDLTWGAMPAYKAFSLACCNVQICSNGAERKKARISDGV